MLWHDAERYVAYMLRLRLVDGEAGPIWRATLDAVATGEHITLADLDELLAYLRRRTDAIAAWPQEGSTEGDAYED